MRSLAAFCLALLCVGLHGQHPGWSFTDSAILQRLRSDIFTLASDSFQGRQAGSRGDSLTCDFLVSRFREIGLEPLGDSAGSYLQPVILELEIHPTQQNSLYTDDHRYIHRLDFGMMAFSSNGEVSGELLNIGHGLSGPHAPWDDYAGKPDPSGKVLLMELPLPESWISDAVKQPELSVRNRLEEAFRRGAVAVLMWNSDVPEYRNLFDFRRTDTLPGKVLFVTDRVARQLKKKEGSLVHAEAMVVKNFIRSNNVIGYLDHKAGKTVILGAHFDHDGLNSKGLVKAGADDNASGTALILELSRYLKQKGDSGSDYLVVAFGAEEKGMIGSNYFCRHPVVPLEQVVFMCNFDMVGRLGAEGNRITALGTKTSPEWGGLYKRMPCFGFRVKKYKGPSSYSDQDCFYDHGIPLFYLTTGMHPDYHTHRDRPDRINYTGMVQIARFSEAFITMAGQYKEVSFQKVSPWATLLPDLHYYIQQLGHILDMPWQDL
jgi:hypothetical protein